MDIKHIYNGIFPNETTIYPISLNRQYSTNLQEIESKYKKFKEDNSPNDLLQTVKRELHKSIISSIYYNVASLDKGCIANINSSFAEQLKIQYVLDVLQVLQPYFEDIENYKKFTTDFLLCGTEYLYSDDSSNIINFPKDYKVLINNKKVFQNNFFISNAYIIVKYFIEKYTEYVFYFSSLNVDFAEFSEIHFLLDMLKTDHCYANININHDETVFPKFGLLSGVSSSEKESAFIGLLNKSLNNVDFFIKDVRDKRLVIMSSNDIDIQYNCMTIEASKINYSNFSRFYSNLIKKYHNVFVLSDTGDDINFSMAESYHLKNFYLKGLCIENPSKMKRNLSFFCDKGIDIIHLKNTKNLKIDFFKDYFFAYSHNSNNTIPLLQIEMDYSNKTLFNYLTSHDDVRIILDYNEQGLKLDKLNEYDGFCNFFLKNITKEKIEELSPNLRMYHQNSLPAFYYK